MYFSYVDLQKLKILQALHVKSMEYTCVMVMGAVLSAKGKKSLKFKENFSPQ